MINRREVLTGVSAAVALTALPSLALATPESPATDLALDLIVGRVKASLNHCLLCSELEMMRPAWQETATLIDDTAALRKHLHTAVEQTFSRLPFSQAKHRYGSLTDQEGRMWPSLQFLFEDQVAILPSWCDLELFEAYLELAPANLR